MKQILVINSGSSSIKFQLLQMPNEEVLASGMVDRIGLEQSNIKYQSESFSIEKEENVSDHTQALNILSQLLLDKENGVVENKDDIDAVGHRVVHGGANFTKTTFVNQEVKDKIKDLFSLAPLHNVPNFKGIEVAEEIFPSAKQLAIFDTAFHTTIPEKAHKYAIPNEFYEKKIRLYGFHGTSHKYVSEKANEVLELKNSKLVTVHLGNGCSISAVKDGICIDHSLGFGPMNGLIMGTRSGDIDQSVIFYLIDKYGYSSKEINELLNKKSGMLGLTGFSDLRDIESEAEKGNKNCQLALEMNAYRIKKYIGSYAAAMNGLDAIVFTAGIGENSSVLRSLVCRDMDYLGIQLDLDKNEKRSREVRTIHGQDSRVSILVVPTNEELEIARQVYSLI
ncbi:acetate kinase [Mangrovimonas sp. AS39]|uniref:acetate/propionate family kinase n=1 Tax=Mangrovimonas futianensis TaxID=2895523 RepID=UPI001E2C5947|nr:acetate kinase [Mangrovimonas futianensis]MCF1191384.1 acetate kinase [Mangrovimonas futianensis]MCF1195079.1 acetate kinase [Mangrovimonas futianensis]MCF1421243.1 acetate kinase [Mangrovimonas futianensis]